MTSTEGGTGDDGHRATSAAPERGLLAGEPPDLRLLIPAAAAWLAAAMADQGSVGRSHSLAILLAVLGAGSLCWSRRPRSLVVCAAAWCAAGATLAGAWSTAAAVRGPLPGLAAAHATVTLGLVVTGDPHLSAASAGGRQVEVLAARAVEVNSAQGDVKIRSPIVILASGGGWSTLLPSQQLRSSGRLAPASRGELEAAVFDARGSPSGVTPPSRLQRIAGRIRAGMRAAARPLPAAPRGLLPGLVDGDTSGLSPQLEASFRATGLTHIVAVSGANVAILLGAVLVAARWAGLRLRGQAVAGAVAIAAFVVVARPQASVLRAAAMGLIAVAALATGRRARALPALCAAVLVLILLDPQLAISVGFALSVLATGALVVLAPVIRERLARWLPRWLAEAISVPAAATIACAPIIVMISGRVSLSSIPANLLAEPAVAPATVLGVLAACTAPVALPLAQLFARLGGLPCSWLILVARIFSSIPGSTVRWPAGGRGALLLTAGFVVSAALVAALRPRCRPGRRTVAAAVTVLLAASGVAGWRSLRATPWPPTSWVFAACDVGQGDALVVRTGPASAILIDAGPDAKSIAACLDQLGIRQLPLVLLTGFSATDVDGLLGAFIDRHVGVVASASALPATAPADRLTAVLASNGARLAAVSVGDHGMLGTTGWDILGPLRSYHGTGADDANDGLVARFTVGGVSILATGDIGAAAQSDLLSAGLASVDVLVVPHHGAAELAAGFVAAVRPSIALVSAGNAVSAGKAGPDLAVMATIQADVAIVARTDTAGSIAVTPTAGRLEVVTQRGRRHDVPAVPTGSSREATPATSRQRIVACCGSWLSQALPPESAPSRSWWVTTSFSSNARSPPPPPPCVRWTPTPTCASW